jgi:sulfotransferase family protein
VSIRVIGAGLGRTGTLSLKAALEELGFGRCYHMIELLTHPEEVHYWEAASRGEPVAWDALFEGCQAVVDYPGCRYYRELTAHYPDARVILTVRDPESWYESARETIYQVGRPRSGEGDAPPAPPPFPGDPQLLMRIFQMARRDVWEVDFGGRFEDREHAIQVFTRWNAQVKEQVPADRLLVYQVKEGWEPLCRFLGVPVPEGRPFPRLNDRETFRARAEGRGPRAEG